MGASQFVNKWILNLVADLSTLLLVSFSFGAISGIVFLTVAEIGWRTVWKPRIAREEERLKELTLLVVKPSEDPNTVSRQDFNDLKSFINESFARPHNNLANEVHAIFRKQNNRLSAVESGILGLTAEINNLKGRE